jgi:hypothetical protein
VSSFPVHEFEIRAAAHQQDLLREAAMERLAREAQRHEPGMRARIAAGLYAVAAKIDASAVPVSMPASGPTTRTVSMNGTSY